jgi:hypothetical protein
VGTAFPLGEVVGGVGSDQDRARVGQIDQHGHLAGGVARGLNQPDQAIAEQVGVAVDGLPMQLGAVVVGADVSTLHWVIRGQRSLALPRVNDSVREVSDRARVIDVQMDLDDMGYIPGATPSSRSWASQCCSSLM